MEKPEGDLESGLRTSLSKTVESEKHDAADTESVNENTPTRPETALEEVDPTAKFIVDWTEGDPEKPVNWTKFKKWKNLWIVSAITFITYVSLISTPVAKLSY
tara:strand:- start:391 stop:699 length:309 start_codon:yes stop_codon:yes gene_type:complete